MAKNGITGETAERIILSITSFALYGFPESHAASFALLAYASAYLKVHYPAAFYTSLLNNQPMGFYHPATLVKDAQRRGVRFHPIDVQQSDWLCRVEPDGAIRLGLVYVHGLRKDAGQAMAAFDRTKTSAPPVLCAKCGSDDDTMIEVVADTAATASAPSRRTYFCNICSHEWSVVLDPVGRFTSIEQMVQRTSLRRDELTTLADIGALNAFTHERRSALWQVERAVRPAGELFTPHEESEGESPLQPMTMTIGSTRTTRHGVTIGPHPMALRRDELARARCVLRIFQAKDGRRVRGRHGDHAAAAGTPGIRVPDARGRDRHLQRDHPARSVRPAASGGGAPAVLLVDGVLQHQDGAVGARRARGRIQRRRGRGRTRFLLASWP
jgi:error-prone DNA polymerase